jgi:signal transduction histidine kinase/CheY-like chemotaxis protein
MKRSSYNNKSYKSLLQVLEIRFLIIFLTLFFLMACSAGAIYFFKIESQRNIIQAKELHSVKFKQEHVSSDISFISSDLSYLSRICEILLSAHNDMPLAFNKAELESHFLNFSSTQKIYDQIRFLDESGMEVVRINFNEGDIEVVPVNKLQNKVNRYYFKDAFVLNKNQIFVSPLDLNIENKMIEHPLEENIISENQFFNKIWIKGRNGEYVKPMIRFGKPVFDKNEKNCGIVLLNYFGANILKSLNEFNDFEDSKLMLLNSDGYYLNSEDPNNQYGFMYDDKVNKISNLYSQEWSRIQSSKSGQFYTKNGLFSFSTINPLLEGLVSSTDSVEPLEDIEQSISDKGYYWKVVSLVPSSVLKSLRNEVLLSIGKLFLLPIILIALMSFYLAKFYKEKNGYLLNLKDRDNKLIELAKFPSENPNPVIRISCDFKLLYANQPGRKLLDSENKDLSDATIPSTWIVKCSEMIKGEKKIITTEYKKNNRTYTVVFNNIRDCSYINVYASDITERKFAEQKIKAIFNSTPVGMMLVNDKTEIIEINREVVKLTGKDINKLIGVQPGEILNCINSCPELGGCGKGETCQGCPVRVGLKKALETGQETNSAEVKMNLKISNKLIQPWLSISIVPTFINNEKNLVIAFTEITKIKKAEESMLIAKIEAENAVKVKSEFLANMSHEIRTPMNSIIGFSDILAEDDMTSQQHQYVSTIRKAGSNLLNLINDILDFSKVEAGKFDIIKSKFQLIKTVNYIEAVLRPAAIKKNIDFQIIQCDKLPEFILTDQNRLIQCLTNLVNNAIKFTEEGHVYVNMSCKKMDNNDYICFDVEDTGIGIADDQLETVFESFIQADGSTSRKYGGTGLGLTITKQMAGLMGGSVTVKSKIGKGTTFSLLIPIGIDLSEAGEMDKYEFVNEISNKTTSNCNKYSGKVLVAEDNPSNQMLIKLLLKKAGIDAVVVENGQQVIEAALKDEFDLILMDIQMPVINGFEAVKKLREDGSNMTIVALTANSMEGDEQKCIDSGFDGYLSKPINKDKLISVLDMYLMVDNSVDNIRHQVDDLTLLCEDIQQSKQSKYNDNHLN